MVKLLLTLIVFMASGKLSNAAEGLPEFWNIQRKGVNIFNVNITNELVRDAKIYNIGFARLALDKFPTKHRDFLIGNSDDYKGLIAEDLVYLKNILNIFQREKIPVVITMLSLPGARWKQHNGNKNDFKLYQDEKFVRQAGKFWFDLAKELGEYTNIVGYNLLNEPRYERLDGIDGCSKRHQDRLFAIYGHIIEQIRTIDPKTAIVLDVSSDADPQCFEYLEPLKDDNIIYSFHMYQPLEYTFSNAKWNKSRGKYNHYPVVINSKKWDQSSIEEYLNVVSNWQKKYNIASNAILVGEFGSERTNFGVDDYFGDLIKIFNKNNWHWAFYAFQEDTWDKMDYQLGKQKLNFQYWKNYDQCDRIKFNHKKCHNLNRKYYAPNAIFSTLEKEFQG